MQLQRYTVEGAKGYLANENKRLSERSEKIHPVKNSIINALEQIDKALTLDC